MILKRTAPALALIATLFAGCSSSGPPTIAAISKPAAIGTAPVPDNATRASPVVVGRPSRIFVMTSVDASCRSLPEPQITITQPPGRGDITFKPGQQTTLAATAQGTCIGRTATGTGIYYTARAAGNGSDTFAIAAKAATGEVLTRAFEVKITE